jgi:phytoene synthase
VIADAYHHCWRIAVSHYENFTLGSWLLPRRLRRHIAAIYAFARAADDMADEGTLTPADRLSQLDAWEQQLEACYRSEATHPVFVALRNTAQRFDLPIEPFRKLLRAFRTDAEFKPFATFDDVLGYCRNSADPVGHLILYLFGYRDAERQQLADQICTGLQLANFWQDVAVDAAKGRLYVPHEDLARFGCSAAEVQTGARHPAVRALMKFEVDRARDMLTRGLGLAALVERRLSREVSLFAWGGLAILDAIEAIGYDVCRRRPTVSAGTKFRLVLRALAGLGPRIAVPDSAAAPPAVSAVATTHDAPYTLRKAYAYCQEITRRSSSSFYYPFRLLAPDRRDALFAVYAFCRFIDDVADDEGRRDPAALLARWRTELAEVYTGKPTHPIAVALADAVQRFELPQTVFLELIDGVEMDLTRQRYGTIEELYGYCYRVASTVGLLCIGIFGYQRPSARDYAVNLGIAFQLTNILRDVREDAQRGRIYLPLEDLRRFDCTEDDLLGGHYSPRVEALMAFECERARAYYQLARNALAPEDRGSLAAAEAMRSIYERLLDRIEARHFDVFGPKVTLPRYEKLTLALAAWGRCQLAVLTS